ncbi:MAG: 4-hydroxy-tetrahydrodipicolinate synthase [Opitutaceae bacterium]|nr:4-hydroxy-tetrahydrodipicolinate synthase [Cytophagales bacterium]
MNSDIKTKFTGTGLALITPFTSNLSVDFPALERLIERGIKGGVEFLAVFGTTGEPVTLTKAEKKDILEFVLKVNNKRLPVMIGLGGNNTLEVLETIKATNFSGVDGILSVCPYYNKPSQEGVYRHYVAIADECPVPVMLYNIPGRTGINMTVSTTLKLAVHKNIIGVKEASGDLTQCMEIAKSAPKDFLLVAGDDLLAVPMIAIGAQGSIAVLPNIFPDTFSDMIRFALKGDFLNARKLLYNFAELNPLLYAEGNPVGAKAVLKLMGVCENFVRLPLAEASEGLTASIEKVLNKQEAVKV